MFIRWQDIADIIIMSFLVYQLYGWFKNTKAFQVVIGLGSLGVVYLVTRNLGFFMTSWILQELGTALFVLIIVIFQSEIRQALYRFSPLRNFFGRQDNRHQLDLVDLAGTIFLMAREKVGALIVFQREEPVDEYLLHGVVLDSVLSGQLVASIFKNGTPLHDGAVVIRHGRLFQASAHLPLSVSTDLPRYYGTRHRAAIGLSERSDAAVVVVSEERGEVSLALSGKIEKVNSPERLVEQLGRLLYSPVKEASRPVFWKSIFTNFRPKVVTVLLVFITWLVITARQGEITNTVVPVKYHNLPNGFILAKSYPDEVEVQLKAFSNLIPSPKDGSVAAEVDLSHIKEGSNTVEIRKEDFTHPPGLVVMGVKPASIKIFIEKKARKLLRVEGRVLGKLSGKHKLRKMKVEPAQVMVEGPESTLSRLEEIQTEPVLLEDINESTTVERRLVAPATQAKVISDEPVKIRLIVSH